MPRRQLTPELIDSWKGSPYLCDLIDSWLRLADCLEIIWDLSHDDALTLLGNHRPALDAASIMGHSLLRTAYTVGWLDIESGRSIILASLGRDA
jgi:hypothetical protein